MLFLQILAVVTSVIIGVWIIGVFLVSNLNTKATQVSVLNLVIGIPIFSLGLWLPFAFGWIVQ